MAKLTTEYKMQENNSILSSIHSPHDLKKRSYRELQKLTDEIRTTIVQTTAKTGGHLSSNLGVIELSIALHRSFNCPDDCIVWDVGHQCYTHKLLTGRAHAFSTIRQKDGISGFPKISESVYDSFGSGHASTSISAASGILAGKELQHKKNFVIAVIGDGALTGGLAYEAISNVASCTKNLIVVVNDNGFSISKNKSYLSKYLSKITIGKKYQKFKLLFDSTVVKVPVLGEAFLNFIRRFKRAVKSFTFSSNFFVDFGFEYVGPINGHNIKEMEEVFHKVKQLNLPAVVHIKTKKGNGYRYAENDPVLFHGVGHFDVADGKLERSGGKSFSACFGESLCEYAQHKRKIVAISAAMLGGTKLENFAKKFPDRCFDVGIAEAHAVCFAAGLARSGMKPVVALYATFLQRAYDQIIHDVALQNLPVVFAIDRAGAVANDGETHQGSFDISMLLAVPNMTILSPASGAELQAFLYWGLAQNSPVAIRYPKASVPPECAAFDEPFIPGRGIFLRRSTPAAPLLLLLCTGGLYAEANSACEILQRENIVLDLYHLRCIKPLDEAYLLEQLAPYQSVVFLEEGSRLGGIAERLELLCVKKFPQIKTTTLAFPDSFLSQGTRSEVLETAGLSASRIVRTCREILHED